MSKITSDNRTEQIVAIDLITEMKHLRDKIKNIKSASIDMVHIYKVDIAFIICAQKNLEAAFNEELSNINSL